MILTAFSTINGYPGYVVTVKGEVYSLKRGRPYRLKSRIDHNGYCRVELCKNGKPKYIFAHRLVAEAFIPNPENKPYINHKDENKQNNSVANLEWCTAAENNKHGTRLSRIAEAKKKRILQTDLSGKVLKEWTSQIDAANILNLNAKNINQCLRNKRKSCGGFGWRYSYA